MNKNNNLTSAKKAKNDEFYTQYSDIEKELNAYIEYDKNVFKGKTILLPCDNYEWSNFTKYFIDNFDRLGLKKLISTNYALNNETQGKMLILTSKKITKTLLKGDGDFRSEEVTKLRDEADFIITNPPFSLFREFIAWIIEAEKQFLILGNMNAITYKDVFPLIKENKVWLGPSITSGDREFIIPNKTINHNKFTGEVRDGIYYQRVMGVRWFTNIDHGRRHEPLQLMTEVDNIKFSKNKDVKGVGYKKYDNYDAIEVSKVVSIPSDYTGVMGVPISFLSKYNPDQFEILGADGYDGTPPTKTYGHKVKMVDGTKAKSNTGTMGCVIKRDSFGSGTYFDVGYPVQAVYKRIFIRHKKAKNK